MLAWYNETVVNMLTSLNPGCVLFDFDNVTLTDIWNCFDAEFAVF